MRNSECCLPSLKCEGFGRVCQVCQVCDIQTICFPKDPPGITWGFIIGLWSLWSFVDFYSEVWPLGSWRSAFRLQGPWTLYGPWSKGWKWILTHLTLCVHSIGSLKCSDFTRWGLKWRSPWVCIQNIEPRCLSLRSLLMVKDFWNLWKSVSKY